MHNRGSICSRGRCGVRCWRAGRWRGCGGRPGSLRGVGSLFGPSHTGGYTNKHLMALPASSEVPRRSLLPVRLRVMQFRQFSSILMLRHNSVDNKGKSSWSACPSCSADLGARMKTGPPYLECPFCGTPIMPVWWQRIPWVTLGFLLSFAVPALIGLGGLALLLSAVICLFPATVFAYIFVFSVMPPKYVRRQETFTSLFHRHG